MAIIDCPQCQKAISDKNKDCPHCHLDMRDLNDDKLASIQRVNHLKSSQNLVTHQFIAMLLFLAGCFSFYTMEDKTSPQYTLAQASALVGFVWYIINRARIILAKRNLSGMN